MLTTLNIDIQAMLVW